MEEEMQVEIPAKFKDLVEQIEKLSVLDLAELVKVLEKKFGVSATAAPIVMAAIATGATEGEKAEEKTSFNIELTASGDNKIGVIKVIREITQLGLKECKDLVDAAPKMIKEGVSKEEAEQIKKKIEEAGGKAELK
ncbi:50S ribosomal protein L7/L12 [Candidatus Kuenenbacteria bacterium HGW-Kuenenbacteria-1]|uniref:Large ribosomal subunit protein bL12 n=1 Tax=Candidatus Kuenenbacteria bacterium HGW-Kuenenbacteria-1 TaxID=2013812 RepID=A0A2N1UNU8_9BACT|nr:MAG: 50S ribosomal protein L7/L12 [Candidatus Kuenenbacteria bacterium HGW-Kuenenbacteria-1]